MADKPIYQADKVAEQARRARFQEQCFLLYHRYQIRDALKQAGTRDFIQNPVRQPGSESGVERVLDYNHIVTIDSDQPEYLASQISALDGAEIFFDLDANILSQLKPIVELYKIYPNKQTTTKGVKVPLRVPFLLGEGIDYRLKGHAQTSEQRATNAAIDDLFRSHNVLGNVMPHNFRIKFAGKDIAWVNAIDQFSFSLSFSSFKLFNHKFVTTDDNDNKVPWSYTDLISTPPGQFSNSVAPEINSLDSLPSSECPMDWDTTTGGQIDSKPITNPKHNPEHFEIQAVIRYDSEIDWDMAALAAGKHEYDAKDREKLENFLRGSALVVRLQFKQHTIRYSMGASGGTNSEFVLDLDYAAYLEGVLSSPDLNILSLNDAAERSIEILETDLAYAKRLMAEVRSKDLTLNQAITGRGTDTNNENDVAKAYLKLRQNLATRMGWSGQWLINLPTNNAGEWLPFHQIIPTRTAIETERKDAPKESRPAKYPNPDDASLRSEKVPKDVELAPGQSVMDYRLAVRKENAVRVFQELINAYDNYIARKRRAFQQERYREFFHHLLGKGRIYRTEALPRELGIFNNNSDDRNIPIKSDLIVADDREELPPPTSWTQLATRNVTVAVPADVTLGDQVFEEFQQQAVSLQKDAILSFRGAQEEAQLITDQTKHNFQAGTNKLVYFTTFGDILDIAIDVATREHIDDGKTVGTYGPGLFDRRMGVLLGPLIDDNNTIIQGFAGRETFNLAHMPVSLSLLMGWWIQNVAARERTVYTLHQFIRDLIKDLAAKMLGESCIEGGGNRSEDIKIINFTSEMKPSGNRTIPPFWPAGPKVNTAQHYPLGGNSSVRLVGTKNGALYLKGISRAKYGKGIEDPDDPNKMIIDPDHPEKSTGFLYDLPWGKSFPNNNVAGHLTKVNPSTRLEDQFNYMFIYVHSYNPKNLDPAAEKENIRKGIYYLRLGQMTSIVKSCAFTRMEIPYWREMKIAGQTSRTGATMLQDVYDARVALFGNNIFKVGSHVFVDPTKDGAEDFLEWKRLGIGGFYLVTEVEHILLHDDVAQETNLKLRYVSSGGCGANRQPVKFSEVRKPTKGPGTDREERAALKAAKEAESKTAGGQR